MADAARNRLPSGYDEDFVNAVEDDCQCLICHLPLKEPVLTRCGHRFCKDCLEEYFRRSTLFNRQGGHSQQSNCPADRGDLDQDRDVFPDKATERKILSFAIRCPSEGCDWTGELRNKEDHLASCPSKLVSCTNENCQVKVRKKNFKRHITTTCQWRITECKHCSEPHPHCQMKDHIAQCMKFPVICPNNCGHSIPREKIPDHTKKDCPLTLISCPYVQIGCKRKVQRQEVDCHLQSEMKFHLDLACVKLETRLFIWKVENFSEVLRQAKAGESNVIASDPFYTDRTESYGYKLRVKIFPNGDGPGKNTHLSVFISVMKGAYDAILPWSFTKKVKFTLIDQHEDPVKHENIARQFIPDNFPESFARPTKEENKGYGCHEFIPQEKLLSGRYLVDDTLFLQIEIGPSSN